MRTPDTQKVHCRLRPSKLWRPQHQPRPHLPIPFPPKAEARRPRMHLWIQGREAAVSRRDSRGPETIASISFLGICYNRIYTDFVDKGVYRKEYQHMITKLRQARIESGFMQSQVAKKLGKPQSYVSKVEVGQRRLDPMELTQFAKIYKKPITYFIK